MSAYAFIPDDAVDLRTILSGVRKHVEAGRVGDAPVLTIQPTDDGATWSVVHRVSVLMAHMRGQWDACPDGDLFLSPAVLPALLRGLTAAQAKSAGNSWCLTLDSGDRSATLATPTTTNKVPGVLTDEPDGQAERMRFAKVLMETNEQGAVYAVLEGRMLKALAALSDDSARVSLRFLPQAVMAEWSTPHRTTRYQVLMASHPS